MGPRPIFSFSTVEDSSDTKSGDGGSGVMDEFRILETGFDSVDRAAAILLSFVLPEIIVAIATRREGVDLIVVYGCVKLFDVANGDFSSVDRPPLVKRKARAAMILNLLSVLSINVM